MADQNTLIVKINADAKSFIDEMDKSKKAIKDFSTVATDVAKYSAAAFAALTATGGLMLSKFKESEKVMNQTEAALRSTGRAAEVSAKQVAEFSKELSKSTAFDDEEIQQAANTLIRFKNIATGQLKEVTTVAADMAAGLGIGVPEAAKMLGKALTNPAEGITAMSRAGVKFTEEQEKMIKALVATGNAAVAQKMVLSELRKQFEGQAAAVAKGMGAFDQFKVSLENLAESIGQRLAPAAINGVKLLNDFVNLAEEDETINSLATAFLGLGVAITGVATALAGIATVWGKIQPIVAAIGALVGGVGALGLLAGGVGATIAVGAATKNSRENRIIGEGKARVYTTPEDRRLAQPFFETQQNPESPLAIPGMGTASDVLKKPFEELGDSVAKEQAARYKASEDLIKQLDSQIALEKSRFKEEENYWADIDSEIADTSDAISEMMDDYEEGVRIASKEMNEGLVNPLGELGTIFSKLNFSFKDWRDGITGGGEVSKEKLAGIGAGLGNAAVSGAAGAQALIGSLASGVIDTIIPGLGQAMAPIIDAFMKGADYVKNMVNEFAAAIPDIIFNIVDTLSQLDVILIEAFSRFIDRLIERLPDIIQRIVVSFASQMPFVATTLAIELVSHAPEIVEAIIEGIIQGLGDAVKKLFDDIGGLGGNLFGGGGGGGIGGMIGGFVGGIGDVFGFAEGGSYAMRVPEGFNNDTYPARLSSGELVVDRSTSSALSDLVASGKLERLLNEIKSATGAERNLTINLSVGESELAKVMLTLNRNGFRTA